MKKNHTLLLLSFGFLCIDQIASAQKDVLSFGLSTQSVFPTGNSIIITTQVVV